MIQAIEQQYGWLLNAPGFAEALAERARAVMNRPSVASPPLEELKRTFPR